MENTAYSYTYDANGNLLSRTDKADNSVSKYSYNADNKLARVEMPEGVVVTYTYDAGGRRIERTVSKAGTETVTRYVYDGENIIAELDKDGNPTEIFTNGPGIDEPLIMTRSDGANYYYHADALGSITALSDGKGQIAERMAYTAYGLPTRYNAKGEFIENSAIGNTRTYTAREQDDDTGLYYYRARYYDAETGRFTQEDPIGFKGKTTNLYAYVSNSPISHVDPAGSVIVGDFVKGFAGVVSNGFGVVSLGYLTLQTSAALPVSTYFGFMTAKAAWGLGSSARQMYDAWNDRPATTKGAMLLDIADFMSPSQNMQSVASIADLSLDLSAMIFVGSPRWVGGDRFAEALGGERAKLVSGNFWDANPYFVDSFGVGQAFSEVYSAWDAQERTQCQSTIR